MNNAEILSEIHHEMKANTRNPNRPSPKEASKAICVAINRLYKKLCAVQKHTPVNVTFHTSDILSYHQKNIDDSVSVPRDCIEVSTADAETREIKHMGANGNAVVELIVRSDRNGNFHSTMMNDIPTQHYKNKQADHHLAELTRILPADKDSMNVTSDGDKYTLHATQKNRLHDRRTSPRRERR